MLLVSNLKISLPNTRSQRITHLSPKTFTALALIFRFMVHFQLISVYNVKKRSNCIFVHCSVTKTWPSLCDPMECSFPGFPVLHHLLESAQTHVSESVMSSNRLIFCQPLIFLPSIFPSIGVFSKSWLFASGSQSIRTSASASVLPMGIQGWFPLGLTDLISLQFKGLSRVLLQHHNLKASVLWCSALFIVQLSHLFMTTGKPWLWLYDLCWHTQSSQHHLLKRLLFSPAELVEN